MWSPHELTSIETDNKSLCASILMTVSNGKLHPDLRSFKWHCHAFTLSVCDSSFNIQIVCCLSRQGVLYSCGNKQRWHLWHGRGFINAVQYNWMLHRVDRQVLQWRYVGRDEWCWMRIYQTDVGYLNYQKECGRAHRGGVCICVPGVSRQNLMPKKKWICFLN